MTKQYKTCTNCGEKVDIDYNFCPNCKSQSFKSQPAKRSENSPSNLKESFLYWNYDGGIVLSKAKVGGIVTFLVLFISGLFSPVPWAMFVLALIFGALVFLIGLGIHMIKGKPSEATIEYNGYGLIGDLYHLFFFWQNKKTGEFVPSKTKIISFLVFAFLSIFYTPSISFFSIILFGLFFETPAFLIGYGIHKLTNPYPTNPKKTPKPVKPKKEPEKVKEVKKFTILNRKTSKKEPEKPEKSAIFCLTMKNITYIMINVRKSAHFCDA